MIEEFIRQLQQAEAEADAVVAGARTKVQEIERASESALISLRASAEASLKQRLQAIDQEADEQIKLLEGQFERDRQEQLADLDRVAHDHRGAVLELLTAKLISR